MLKKGFLLSAVLMLLLCGIAEGRNRDIVIPTWYGYGVVSARGYVRPFISTEYPYGNHAYGAVRAPSAPMWSAYGIPSWGTSHRGSQGYSLAAVTDNLNIRSQPHVTGKKNRNANVIGSLNTGEQVYLLAQTGNWSFIQSVYMPFRRGYVYSSYLRSFSGMVPGMVSGNHYKAFYPQAVARW